MASLMGALGLLAFHSFIWAWTKRLYAVGWRLGLSSLSVWGVSICYGGREPRTSLGLGVGTLGGSLCFCLCWRVSPVARQRRRPTCERLDHG